MLMRLDCGSVYEPWKPHLTSVHPSCDRREPHGSYDNEVMMAPVGVGCRRHITVAVGDHATDRAILRHRHDPTIGASPTQRCSVVGRLVGHPGVGHCGAIAGGKPARPS